MSFNSGTAYPETINHYLGISETSYTWTVPAINATTCRIKIQVLDTIGNVICEDGSNNNFSIHSITLTFPNGGESFQGGSSQIIKWRTTIGQNFSHYRLLMSYNSDTTYADTIAHYVASSETLYNWQVPIINCNTVRIKVQILDDTNSVISQDNSNTNFAIDAEPPGLFSLVLPLNNGWTNATPRFIWQRAYDNFSMYNYELSISMPDETLLISTQDTINPIIPVGSVWQAKTSHANWSSREQHSSVVFDNKIWIIGGNDGANKNDVWFSTDGVNWTCATTSAPWSARSAQSSVVFDNKIWVIGGNDGANKNDVWFSTNGVNWTCATASAPWSPRGGHVSVVFDNKIWVIGGNDGANKNDIWFSADGVNWICATLSALWSPRAGHTSVVFDNKIWVIGGDNNRDVWYSTDGINWNCATTTAWSWSKSGHSSVVYDDKIWVIGGNYFGNDVWFSTNGSQWVIATYYAEWNERFEHTSVVFRNKMWVMGGICLANTVRFNDVWYCVTSPKLPEGTHTWWVTAYDRAGNSQRSNEIFIVQVDTTIPTSTAPISPINGITITNASINFVWQRASDILSGIQYYKFQIATNPTLVNSNNISVLDTCITLNLPDTVYYWRLKTIDNVNNESEWSNIANFRVRAAGFIEEQALHAVINSKILIYPNPASSYLVIHFPLSVSNIKIYDITGKLVRSKKLEVKNSQKCRINLHGIKNGVYFIKTDDLNCPAQRFTVIN